MRANIDFVWTDDHQSRFDRINTALCNSPLLAWPNPNLLLVMRTDASDRGVGGVLFQMNPNCDSNADYFETLSFFSRKFSLSEMLLCTMEKEALGVLYGLDKCRSFLIGPVQVWTDNSDLTFLRHSSNKRVQRWAVAANEFDITVVHRPGRTNCIADALSRLLPRDEVPQPSSAPAAHVPPAFPSSAPETSASVPSVLTATISVLSPASLAPLDRASNQALSDSEHSAPPGDTHAAYDLADAAHSAPHPDADDADDFFHIIRDLPHERTPNGILRFAHSPPHDIVLSLLALAHDHFLSGHFGATRTLQRLTAAVQWPGVEENNVKQYVHACSICQKIHSSVIKAPDMLSTAVQFPNDTIFIDFVGPLQPAPFHGRDCRYILTVVDRFTRWCELTPLPDDTARSAAEALFESWICEVVGSPRVIASDNGSHFSNQLMAELARCLDITWHFTCTYHHQSAGAVERLNRVLHDTIRALLRDEPNWARLVGPVQIASNTAVNRMTG